WGWCCALGFFVFIYPPKPALVNVAAALFTHRLTTPIRSGNNGGAAGGKGEESRALLLSA
uniref:hypothetical protein n=1 Tax=Rothia mucilaginosa TaxID=43675 RepID=UPI0028D6F9EE